MKKKMIPGLVSIVSFVWGFFLGGKVLVGMVNDYKRRMKRNLSNMMLFNDWLDFLYSGGKIEQYFHNQGYKRIMIYGNGHIGKRLRQALDQTDIEVVAVMDKVIPAEAKELVIGIDSAVPDIDCIIVTPVFFYDEISAMLEEKTNVPIVSLQIVIEKG